MARCQNCADWEWCSLDTHCSSLPDIVQATAYSIGKDSGYPSWVLAIDEAIKVVEERNEKDLA